MQTVEQVKKRIDYLLERDQATEAEIEKVYNEAVDTLRAIVSDVHNRYAVDGVVVPTNLYGKVTVKDMLLLKQQYNKLPDDLSAQEQDRVDYYTAISQTSPRGLVTALVGMALIAVTHKVAKIITKNNRTAVKEEIAYQEKYEKAPKMTIKKYADPEFKVKTGKDFIPWTERVLADHDQAVNRINNVINSMVSQGMRAEDIADHFYPGNAQSMRDDNIPKILRDATIKAKRTARTEAASREDAITEQSFKANDVKYYDWVTEPGACKICTNWAISGPYKVGDESSPRVPGSSHPNCRCRRIRSESLEFLKQEETTRITRKKYDGVTLSEVLAVNRKLVNSYKFHDKFSKLDLPKKVQESVYQVSMKMLENRDGSIGEDIAAIDSRSGKVLFINQDSNAEGKVNPTPEQYEKIMNNNSKVVLVHTHPGNGRPSIADILTLERGEKYVHSSVIVGHKGAVYEISLRKDKKFELEKAYNKAYNEFVRNGNSSQISKLKATDILYNEGYFNHDKY